MSFLPQLVTFLEQQAEKLTLPAVSIAKQSNNLLVETQGGKPEYQSTAHPMSESPRSPLAADAAWKADSSTAVLLCPDL